MSSSTSRAHWDAFFSGDDPHYGHEPGQVAVRAEKYHRPLRTSTSTALDIGCGEGQDLAFLAARGYDATGVDFSEEGLRKTRAMLAERDLSAQVLQADLATWQAASTYDLVVSINVLGFVGERADFALQQTSRAVASGGMLGLSVWARENPNGPSLQDGVRLWTRAEVLAALDAVGSWQLLEVARLDQYFRGGDEFRPFVTVVAQKLAAF